MKLFKKILLIVVLMFIAVSFWGGLVYRPKHILVVMSATFNYILLWGLCIDYLRKKRGERRLITIFDKN